MNNANIKYTEEIEVSLMSKRDAIDIFKRIKEWFCEKNVTYDVVCKVVLPYFKNNMGYDVNDSYIIKENKKQNCYSEYWGNELLIQYYGEEDIEKAIHSLTKVCEEDGMEWGILFHKRMIVLINSQIPVGDSIFKADKIVFKFEFSRPVEVPYFRYLEYSNLLEQKNTCFFKDIIVFRNIGYDNSQKSWPLYLSATRRLFSFFSEKKDGYSSDIYGKITMTDLEQCLRAGGKTRSEKYIRNQFRYVNKFIKWKVPDSQFGLQGVEFLINDFKDVTEQYYTEKIVFSSQKLNAVFRRLQKGQNPERNQILLLLMFSYGMERKQLCTLRWDEHFKLESISESKVKIADEWFPVPSILAQKLINMKAQLSPKAKYVIGNNYTKNEKQLSEEGINAMLFSIMNRKDSTYSDRKITVGNIRRWLFKYLMDKGYNLVAVMHMMNVSIGNLKNYIDEKGFHMLSRENVKGIGENSIHPMEMFINEIYE